MKIEILPKYRIAYLRQVGPYGPANKEVMEKLKQWADEKNLLTESAVIYGIPQDHPVTTLAENCRYEACIVISNDLLLDDSVCESEQAGGEYIVCKVKHTAEDIKKAWAEIIPAILNSGYQIDNKPIIERFSLEMINNHYCELCVPVISI